MTNSTGNIKVQLGSFEEIITKKGQDLEQNNRHFYIGQHHVMWAYVIKESFRNCSYSYSYSNEIHRYKTKHDYTSYASKDHHRLQHYPL